MFSAVTLGVASNLPPASALPLPGGERIFSTFRQWDGSSEVGPFGCPNATTFGQVITMSTKKTLLGKVTFYYANATAGTGGSMVVRDEVYRWDGTKASGSALFESDPRKLSYANEGWNRDSFNAGGVQLQRGTQYVVFASIDKDYEQCSAGYLLNWGSVRDRAYPGGTFVFQNNGGDESQWTTTAWDTAGNDLAFSMTLK